MRGSNRTERRVRRGGQGACRRRRGDEDTVRPAMAKSRAGRRMQRHEKRQVAKATRDTKYEKQKGGIGKPQHRKKIIHSGAVTEDDNRPMAVIRDGKAVYLNADGQKEEPEEIDGDTTEEVFDGDDGEERFTSAQKKLRALKKKVRKLEALKARRRRGEELDAAQQSLLMREESLRKQLRKFEEAAGEAEDDDAVDAAAPAEPEPDEDDEEEEAAALPPPELAGLSKIEQRRALKRQRHQESLKKKKKGG